MPYGVDLQDSILFVFKFLRVFHASLERNLSRQRSALSHFFSQNAFLAGFIYFTTMYGFFYFASFVINHLQYTDFLSFISLVKLSVHPNGFRDLFAGFLNSSRASKAASLKLYFKYFQLCAGLICDIGINFSDSLNWYTNFMESFTRLVRLKFIFSSSVFCNCPLSFLDQWFK